MHGSIVLNRAEAAGRRPALIVAAPGDAEQVLQAFRLGWALAEVRGRYRPGVPLIRRPPGGTRTDHALPLADERSAAEQLIELHTALAELAAALGVGGSIPPVPGAGAGAQTYPAHLAWLGSQLRQAPTAPLWEQFTESAYAWDAFVQDQLVITASRAAAYQLGRGLAETYWALDPSIEDAADWRSWQFLLGPRRCHTLGRLVARLVDYFDPLTVPAVTTSLNAWAAVAVDPQRRTQPAILDDLYDQGLLWRDLIRAERSPADLAASVRPFERISAVWPVVKAFWVQIVLAVAGAGLLAFSASELAAGSSTKTNTLIAVLSALGITSAGLYARAKGIATSLFGRLQTAFDRDRVGVAATLAPSPPRTITAPLPGRTRRYEIDSASPRLASQER